MSSSTEKEASRTRKMSCVIGLALASALAAGAASAGGVLTVAMTASDIPQTGGNPDQGFEGYRFVGYNLYDALVNWDMSKSGVPSNIKPGLATSWSVDPKNPGRWLFKLREGVKWHDGSAFTADDVVWNLRMRTEENFPNFNSQQFALTRNFLVNFKSVSKLDDMTVAFETKQPDAMFPYNLSYVLLISPARAKAVNYDWKAFALQPSGTGPYLYSKFTPGERLELVPNPGYWDKTRLPRQDKLVLVPMPEATARVAALLSGQVNFIEAPPPDSIGQLKGAGMKISTGPYPHKWPWILNVEAGPFKDVRVRQAANYAVKRGDFVKLLDGLAVEVNSVVPKDSPYFGDTKGYTFDPEKAKALLKEAGCVPCKVTVVTSTSGSGQMMPLPMNELLKRQLDAVGFQVTVKPVDLNALYAAVRGGPEKNPGVDALNFSRGTGDPHLALLKPGLRQFWAPNGSNWGHYESAEAEALGKQAFEEPDPKKRLVVLQKLNAKLTDDAIELFVTGDVQPRAMSPKVQGFVASQNWFQDTTLISVNP
ncbi:ABC-type transport system, substrate-binding protein [Variovorax sp. YR266]|uniref:ABC transporter substrate-binding protein n=1 Tax=Variovorax sp. YR266 TaxID=1884386 RepID=UPI0008969737|nr:ABC transporter substrate-binding protein [Variovorax sp. YR266]SDY33476.1 ABC-type transport system, substrate-binding protein [Variovorax sp. YR266]